MEKNSITKMEERDEEVEETLSFCDLPLNNTKSDQRILSAFPPDDTFEFSVNENLSNHLPENMQFFRKSISVKTEKSTKWNPFLDNWTERVYGNNTGLYKLSASDNFSDQQDQNCHFLKTLITQKTEKNNKSNAYSNNWAKRVYENNAGFYELPVSDDFSDQQDQNSHFLKKSISQKTEKNTKPIPYSDNWSKRVYGSTNILLRQGTVAPANSRWPLLMFGPPTPPRSKRSSGGVREGNLKRKKKMWGVIKALGCGGGHLAVA